jgi:peptide/nickel transport system ATP-binding protein
MTPSAPASVLSVANLRVSFDAQTAAVRGVSFEVRRGETHGVVGESGCGKSVSALSVMNLLPRGAVRTADQILFKGQDLLDMPEREMSRLRGNSLAMIFQEPMTCMNPVYTIGSQLSEVFERHRRATRRQAMDRAAELLERVGIMAPGMRLGQYPHQLSGGLRQRVMIAMALMCDPGLLIADEPTTALDVTVQAQILRLLQKLQQESGLALLLITHDLGVVARMAQHVSVMYAGEIVESGPVDSIFAAPAHPYTRGLLDCIPVPGMTRTDKLLGSIPGAVSRIPPDFTGCAFRNRCSSATPECVQTIPLREAGSGHSYRCRLPPDWKRTASA